MPGVDKAQGDVGMLAGERNGQLRRHDFVAAALKQDRGLREVRIAAVFLRIFDERVIEVMYKSVGVMLHVEYAGLLPTQHGFRTEMLRELLGEVEGRRHQDKALDLRVALGVERGETAAQARADQ